MSVKVKPVRTYEVSVEKYGSALYSARTPGKAMGAAFRSFRNASDKIKFSEFMRIARVQRAKDPPGCGERIVVEATVGKPETVTRCYGPLNNYVYFMRDDADHVVHCHPADVIEPRRVAA